MKAILLAMLLMAATIYATDPRTGMADYTKPIAVIENGQIYNVYPGTQSPRYDQAPTSIFPVLFGLITLDQIGNIVDRAVEFHLILDGLDGCVFVFGGSDDSGTDDGIVVDDTALLPLNS